MKKGHGGKAKAAKARGGKSHGGGGAAAAAAAAGAGARKKDGMTMTIVQFAEFLPRRPGRALLLASAAPMAARGRAAVLRDAPTPRPTR